MMYMPSLAFWEEPEDKEPPRLVRVDDPAAPVNTGPHCKWCDINLNHPNCVNNAEDAANPCPQCRYDPEDVTAHQWSCPRIGTTGNDGPNFTDPPWSVDDPAKHKYLSEHCTAEHLRKIRYGTVMDVLFLAMARCNRVWLPDDAPSGEQEEFVSMFPLARVS